MPGERRHVPHGGHIAHLGAEDANTVSRGIAPENFHYEQSVEAARKQGDLELKIGNSAIRNEYQKRLADVANLRNKSQQVLGVLELERSALQYSKEGIVTLLRDFESTLQVNMDWMALRKKQATDEIGSAEMKKQNATIQLNLEESATDLKHCLLALANHLSAVQAALADVDRAIRLVKDDIVTKSSTMVVDRACMEGLVAVDPRVIPASPIASPRSSRSKKQQPAAMLTFPSPRRGSADTDWQRKGEVAAANGLHVVDKTGPVRKAAQDYITQIKTGGKLQRNAAVVDALRTQVKCGAHLELQLELNKKALSGQLSVNNRQQAALSISLGNVEQQLKLANQRLAMSDVRPAPESSPANVENMLGIEIAKLKRNQADLQGKLRGLADNSTKTESMVKTLEKQVMVAKKTTDIAKACIDVKLPPISSPRSAQVSPRIR
ncbi:Hypothetical protein, putative [Bodo saltans]|uniref:Uncharacterized protein n=1 Tax=Bodo saltans TaxID=75058 RepID=A0A0S4JJ04_BODSA|nr:Hypothetical protein, putative [Bodo saltans]|eukprot:CUG88978.1 Hypothetical protein, putative [Bodo saltans]